MEANHLLLWGVFWTVVVGLLAADFICHRHAPAVDGESQNSFRNAVIWSLCCIAFAGLFCLGIRAVLGSGPALEFLAGYLVEESLSVDNLFVFLLIFRFFQVKAFHQHRVLFWGILGAMVLRIVMILGGVALVHRFEWILYLFGVFLVYIGIKLVVVAEDATADPSQNLAVKLVRKIVPITAGFRGEKFLVIENGRLMATPLLLVLITVEFSDIVFAVDSIPAVFGVTRDPFIIVTSNICAILGLRALFFVLSGTMDKFRYLKVALAIILTFIGIKMLVAHWIVISTGLSLTVVVSVLVLALLASLLKRSA